jgi:uncharacterized membrane protein YhaH (DUF805 family)
VNFQTAVKSGFQNYANFNGRSSRSAYWWFILFSQIAQILAQSLHSSIGTLVSLACLIPIISVNARRLHDIGRSARWLFLPVASLVGALLAVVGLLMQTDQSFENLNFDDLISEGMQVWVWLFVAFMISAFITSIVNFVFTLQQSDPDMNQYGPPAPPTL